MSTVKIKTEPTAAVDVQVKLEPSLSTADIKLEQHASDTETKFESDLEADSEEEDYIKSESDDDDNDDADQNQAAEASNNQRQFICEYLGCGRRFKSGKSMRLHQREHRLQTEISIFGKSYILARQSLDDRWPCPIPDCTSTYKTVSGLYMHIRTYHGDIVEQQQHQRQQLSFQFTPSKHYFVDVDDVYVNGVRCGYHTTTGLFICYKCRLVPDCLLTHLQQKHGYDEKSIDSSALPDSALNESANPNGNQHISNSHLATAIRDPYQWRNSDIVQGWMCVKSDCGYCCFTKSSRRLHQYREHRGEQIMTVPALLLRLLYARALTSCFLITKLDEVATNVNSSNSISQNSSGCEEDDGDELVLRDYSD